jgi:hypothetical protein
MEFVEGLPISGSANNIMVVVDKFTKYAHFIPLHHPFIAAKVTSAYIDNVFKMHALPEVMIFDRDLIFTSKFWQELFSTLGSELRMSSAYHPQTDGQTERVNQCRRSTYAILLMLALLNGANSCLSQNFGTTTDTILPSI